MPEQNDDRRIKKLAVAQAQLAMLQKFGKQAEIGLAALNHLREIILNISTHFDEFIGDQLFQYRLGNKTICAVNWYREGIQVIFTGEHGSLVFDVDNDKHPDWDSIKQELWRRIPSAIGGR